MLTEFLTPVGPDGPQYGSTPWNDPPYYSQINSWSQDISSNILGSSTRRAYINFRLFSGMNIKYINKIIVQLYINRLVGSAFSVSLVQDTESFYKIITSNNLSLSGKIGSAQTIVVEIDNLLIQPDEFNKNYYIGLISNGAQLYIYEMRLKIEYSANRTFAPKLM